jgi:hypothetical protein
VSRKEPKTLRVAGLRPFLPQTVPRTVCRFADRRELNGGRRKTITFKSGAYWWSPSEGAYPLSAALENIKHQGGWIETIPNPNYRPKGLLG